ncbi:ABC transporter permease [Marispirochaeta sp.]|jgi:ribose transport system permease protein|uniref:ABC transporter permease n=1 Tax=Marispirochaeta sp. TaxID=2038653 RepID=UPI0029C75A32|nr:ABC transporter permease [Marispirochaeta sp.]
MSGAIKRAAREYLVLILVFVLVLITAILEPKFLSSGNLTNIMRQFGPLIMVAMGMTFVIIGGYIDLSVAGIMSLVAVVTLSLIESLGQGPALLVGLLLGTAAGFLNSLVITRSGAMTQAEGLFISYGMSVLYGGAALLYTGGVTNHLSYLDVDYSMFTSIGSGTVGIFSVSFLIFLGLIAVLYFFQNYTYVGRAISLTGGNKTAANLTGINVNRTIMIIWTISGFMAAVAAIVLFSRVTTASPVLGKGFDLNAILAVVVGGTSLQGGKGSVARTVLGAMLVILLANSMNLLGVTVYMQNVMKGVLLVLAIWLDNLKARR